MLSKPPYSSIQVAEHLKPLIEGQEAHYLGGRGGLLPFAMIRHACRRVLIVAKSCAPKHRRIGHLRAIYQDMVENKEVQEDVHQIDALKALDRLYKELEKTPPQPLSTTTPTTTPSPKQEASYSFFGGFFSKVKHKVKDTASLQSVRSKGSVSAWRCRLWQDILYEPLLSTRQWRLET